MPKREEDPKHLAWVRQQPCLICMRSPCDPHHLLRRSVRGMGRRAADHRAVPLCPEHHRALHKMGDEEAYFAINGVDGYKWADENGENR